MIEENGAEESAQYSQRSSDVTQWDALFPIWRS